MLTLEYWRLKQRWYVLLLFTFFAWQYSLLVRHAKSHALNNEKMSENFTTLATSLTNQIKSYKAFNVSTPQQFISSLPSTSLQHLTKENLEYNTLQNNSYLAILAKTRESKLYGPQLIYSCQLKSLSRLVYLQTNTLLITLFLSASHLKLVYEIRMFLLKGCWDELAYE